ncbi:hypothetical protein SUGI_1170880 [Cryptomeria japonica]|nr:hypothetical protein SUGI_1170880 [Cryptomeria japonica]
MYKSNASGGEDSYLRTFAHSESEVDLVVIDLSEDKEEGIDLWEKLAVICRIVGLKFERRRIKSSIDENKKSKVVVKFIPKGFFIVIFAEVEEERILLHESWFVDNHPLYMQSWFPNFDMVPLAPYDRIIWIRLYNLPIEYWDESSLERIGTLLGTLLEIDEELVENDSYL